MFAKSDNPPPPPPPVMLAKGEKNKNFRSVSQGWQKQHFP